MLTMEFTANCDYSVRTDSHDYLNSELGKALRRIFLAYPVITHTHYM